MDGSVPEAFPQYIGLLVAEKRLQFVLNFSTLICVCSVKVEFQASVMVIGLPTLLNGPWCLSK